LNGFVVNGLAAMNKWLLTVIEKNSTIRADIDEVDQMKWKPTNVLPFKTFF